MQCGKTLVFVAWTCAVACGGSTTTVEEGRETGGDTSSGGAASSGGATSSGGLKGGQTGAGGTSSGGKVGGGGASASGGGGAGGTGGKVGAGGLGTGGTTGCDPIPADPVYECNVRGFQPGDCVQWFPPDGFAADRVLPGYPQGCVVVLPRQHSFSRCGPQRCTCEEIPDPSGAVRSDWLCPL